MKLSMLGTGCALVTECYNTCFVISDENRHFMVDAGGGNQIFNQLKKVNIDLGDIHDFFVTHKHIDHILGVIWVIRKICQSLGAGKYSGEYRIYGHDEVISLLQDFSFKLLTAKQTKFIGDKVKLIEVADRDEKKILDRKVTFFDIASTKAKQFGFCMMLDDKEHLTCCGDEPFNPCYEPYARNSKWLLHEAFCLYDEREKFKPYEKHHSTVKDSCELAEKLKAKNLVLYHTKDNEIGARKARYSAEGRQYYTGNLFIPDDLEVIEL